MSETLEVQSPKCVPTDFLVPLACSWCGNDFVPVRADQVNCTPACNSAKKREVRDQERKEDKMLRAKLRNAVYRYVNRDRCFAFDGRYEGPLTNPITIVNERRKDTGYTAMPIDVHVKPIPKRFAVPTLDDNIYDAKQRRLQNVPMPRGLKNYCTCCREAVFDGKREVRVTKGCYLPVDHECPRTRVYGHSGKLLEVV